MNRIPIILAAAAATLAAISCDREDTSTKDTVGTMIYGHEAVDMGYGLLWATCNIGAECETDYGAFFCWGETSGKTAFSSKKYKFGEVDLKTPDDFGLEKYNATDGRTRLLAGDDAATAQWGESWRMPSSSELESLTDPSLYELEWISKKGKNGKAVFGLEITSKQNNNSIFLPASGLNLDTRPKYQGELGAYWSSSLSRENSDPDAPVYFADLLSISEDERIVFRRPRYSGFTIRAVTDPAK